MRNVKKFKNIFKELGFPQDEADALLYKSYLMRIIKKHLESHVELTAKRRQIAHFIKSKLSEITDEELFDYAQELSLIDTKQSIT